MSMKKYNLFVYGTLKRGFVNDYYLKSATYLCNERIKGYSMYDLGAFPGIKPDEKGYISGERYQIDDDLLPYLDGLEGHPHLYTRTEITTESDVLGTVHDYFIYVYNGNVQGRDKIADGIWKQQTYRRNPVDADGAGDPAP